MRTTAAFAEGRNRPIALDDFDLDGPYAGEVLIEMKAAGLCHSDLSFLDGSRGIYWSRAWSIYALIRWFRDHQVRVPGA